MFKPHVTKTCLRWHNAINKTIVRTWSIYSARWKYRAVIFDMGGVILPSPFPMSKEYQVIKNIPEGTIGKAIDKFGKDGAWPKLEIGLLDSDQFGAVFSDECSATAGKEINVRDFLGYIEKGMSKPIKEVLETIECLRHEGFKTALLTNNWKHSCGNTLLPLDKKIFDVVIESAVVGLNKPHPPIYKLCLNELGVAPDEAIFLDDMEPNITTAKSIGIHTIKVDDVFVAIAELQEKLKIPLTNKLRGTRPVKADMQINLDNLTKYLNDKLQLGLTHNPEIWQFSHGQSNPTYLLDCGEQNLVLRKKPPGKLLRSAHAIEREYRVMAAVARHGVPTPPLHLLCEDASVIGTPFYVASHVHGDIYKDPSLPGMSRDSRREIYNRMVDTLCSIHRVDVDAAGLGDFGKRGSFVGRQTATWTKQYVASKTHEIRSMELLMKWLPQHVPPTEARTIIHGDYRLDNLIVESGKHQVLAVLDWELSTTGDPLSDLVYCCLAHYLPTNFPILPGLKGKNLQELGIPTVDELVTRYCDQMSVPPVDNFNFYMAFTFFKIAAILQGVYKRAQQGQASSAQATSAGKLAEKMADIGWEFACKEGFRVFNQYNPKIGANPPAGIRPAPSSSQTRSFSTSATQPDMRIPIDQTALSPRVRELRSKLIDFMEENVYPREVELGEFHRSEKKWSTHPDIDMLKSRARAEGLWNLFLPLESDRGAKYGAGLTNVEYAFLCEIMGRSFYAPEIFNCQAPDTGNMEILAQFGSEEQKQTWLRPLLDGEIRSCFAMTEPAVASSDATNIQSSIVRDGDCYVINGRKWWTSGVLHPDMKLIVFMGKTDPSATRHQQQTMILVPASTPGIEVVRPLTVFGFDDAPVGHGEVVFRDVRVPVSNVLLAPGAGFRIAQARLGPGRIHHCMRMIGSAERSLDLMKQRISERSTFGRRLIDRDTILRDVALSRIDIDQARLLVLKTAHMMDVAGNKAAAKEIAMIKIAVPRVVSVVIDRCMQVHGAGGLSGDYPTAIFFAWARALRIADGPDEVHERSLALKELKSTSS